MALTKVLIAVKTYPTLSSNTMNWFALRVFAKMALGFASILFLSEKNHTPNNTKSTIGLKLISLKTQKTSDPKATVPKRLSQK